ncbi:MAG: hypothetical protein IJ298_04615 [Ruminococcus sp.]|nr:hypothetical protein [Ruminococcus sp.]
MDETQLLLSRLDDLIYSCGYNGDSYIGFLNERECSLAVSYLRNRRIEFSMDGGYPNATRMYICVSDISEPIFPITALQIKSKGNRELTHRDYLGSLMGLGIKRECIGDIIAVSNNEAVVFVRDDISEYIIRELDRVGREPVTVCLYSGDTDNLNSKTEELNLIVTSMRADNFVSACINSSRTEAARLISSDLVFLNYVQVNKPSQSINEGGIISIRGHGKYIVGALSGKTKRDRLVIKVLHYI